MDLGAEITRWGLGDVSVPITGTLRFIKSILTSSRLTALTEITKGAALSKIAEAYYDKLQRSSGLTSSGCLR